MAFTTPRGFFVWNLGSDPYVHSQLAANWQLVDSLLGLASTGIQTVTTLTPGPGGPQAPLVAGNLVMTSITVEQFPAWTLLRYDGSGWEAVGPVEVQSSIPTQHLYPGRVIILSQAVSGFAAWSIIRYDGTNWNYVGPLQLVNTGSGALNIQGMQINGDLFINSGNRGLVLTDRSTGTKYRIYVNNGALLHEVVT